MKLLAPIALLAIGIALQQSGLLTGVPAVGQGNQIHTDEQSYQASVSNYDLISGLNLNGKKSLVVGGTSGIGHGVALALASRGASVTVVGRNSEVGEAIVEEMRTLSKNKDASFAFKQLDCFDLNAVEALAESEGAGDDNVLDYLILSQGMATIQGFTPTAQGLDQKHTLHIWSRALFTSKLLDALRRSDDGRVLSVLSAGYHSNYDNWASDPELKEGSYGVKTAADAAGMYNDIIFDSFARENPTLTFAHAAPGFVNTNWGTEMPTAIRWLVRGLQVFGRSKENCGVFMLHGLTNVSKGGFHMLDPDGRASGTVVSMHEEARPAIWDLTKQIITAKQSVSETTP